MLCGSNTGCRHVLALQSGMPYLSSEIPGNRLAGTHVSASASGTAACQNIRSDDGDPLAAGLRDLVLIGIL